MIEEMEAEFDTVAEWTAEVALDLGPDHRLPAGCRGSGSPASLRWFLERLRVTRTDRMLDCGAGVGGPAAFARQEVGVVPVLTDPAAGACRAAARLFGFPTVQAGSELPFASGSLDVVWSLGVLCTVPDQPQLLRELRRVLTPQGRLGMLVFVAAAPPLSDQPSGNNFPTEQGLRAMLEEAQLRVENSASSADFLSTPTLWEQRVGEVEAELERRHGEDQVWRTAAQQSALIGRLLADQELTGTMVVARAV
jgi:SAM-dependent methyltransferase